MLQVLQVVEVVRARAEVPGVRLTVPGVHLSEVVAERMSLTEADVTKMSEVAETSQFYRVGLMSLTEADVTKMSEVVELTKMSEVLDHRA
jgi:hypothetical protein